MWRENEQRNTNKPLASVGGPEVQKRLRRSEDNLKAGRFLEVQAGGTGRAVEWLHEGATTNEPAPAISKQAEEMRRRLGTLDPQQVAIWREMTSARKLELLFQMWHLARKMAWSTERRWHPELTEEELSQRVWKRFHGSDMPCVPANQP